MSPTANYITREIFNLIRTIAVLNTVPGSTINIKEITGN